MVTGTLNIRRAGNLLLVCRFLLVGLCGCGSSSIDDTGGSLSIGESGAYPYWLVMQGCSDCTLGLTTGSTTVAIIAPARSNRGRGVASSGRRRVCLPQRGQLDRSVGRDHG